MAQDTVCDDKIIAKTRMNETLGARALSGR
jgi:hypothetical protein